MNIFLRTFNNKINSKSGATLPEGQYRGSPEWLQFQNLLIKCLNELGNETETCKEWSTLVDPDLEYTFDKRIYVHQTKREKLNGDLFWMQMHLRELFTIDTNGWGADHSEYPNFKSYFPHMDEYDSMRFCQEKSDSLFSSGISKVDQPQTTDMTPERFILVPTQTPRDYTLKHHSPITMKYFIDSVQAWANESRNHVVFKLHPFGRDADLVHAVESGLSHYVHKAEGNIHELIKRSDGLFIINSGTGFESLIHGKPVASFGTCDYNSVTFNADIRRLDEARNFIYSYKEEWRRLAYKFVYWYCHHHAYDVTSPSTPERLTKYLRGALNA